LSSTKARRTLVESHATGLVSRVVGGPWDCERGNRSEGNRAAFEVILRELLITMRQAGSTAGCGDYTITLVMIWRTIVSKRTAY
jgi:hypothetical protein